MDYYFKNYCSWFSENIQIFLELLLYYVIWKLFGTKLAIFLIKSSFKNFEVQVISALRQEPLIIHLFILAFYVSENFNGDFYLWICEEFYF